MFLDGVSPIRGWVRVDPDGVLVVDPAVGAGSITTSGDVGPQSG
jgi:hypothetical protein